MPSPLPGSPLSTELIPTPEASVCSINSFVKPESPAPAPKESEDLGGVTVSLLPKRSACVGSRRVCFSKQALPFLT